VRSSTAPSSHHLIKNITNQTLQMYTCYHIPPCHSLTKCSFISTCDTANTTRNTLQLHLLYQHTQWSRHESRLEGKAASPSRQWSREEPCWTLRLAPEALWRYVQRVSAQRTTRKLFVCFFPFEAALTALSQHASSTIVYQWLWSLTRFYRHSVHCHAQAQDHDSPVTNMS
jgi:hypothetical protein